MPMLRSLVCVTWQQGSARTRHRPAARSDGPFTVLADFVERIDLRLGDGVDQLDAAAVDRHRDAVALVDRWPDWPAGCVGRPPPVR